MGDYDNDRWPDIYVTDYGKNRLYPNNHDGTFTDVAEKAGVALDGWSAGPTWDDYDRDGWLDLFVPGYVNFDLNHLPKVCGAKDFARPPSPSCHSSAVVLLQPGKRRVLSAGGEGGFPCL